MPPGQVVSLIIVVVFIFGAFYARHLILQRMSGHSNIRAGFGNRKIAVLDRFAISRDKSFCIVEVAGKIYLVAMTNQAVTLLDTFDAAEFEQASAESRAASPVKVPAGNSLKDRMTRSLAGFMARRMGRTIEFEDSADKNESSFAETMRAASNTDSKPVPEDSADSGAGAPEGKA